MTRVAVIGLGIMGRPMAANLVGAGFEVTGFTRTPGDGYAHPVAASLEGAVADAEFVLAALPTTETSLAVAQEVAALAPAGSLFIDTSTIEPQVAVEMADLLATVGIGALDAPVSGGEAGAIEGSLSVMAGGSAEHYARALPVLGAIGSTIVHVGPAGSGQLVKAANQMIVAGNIQMLAEALVFLRAHGVEPGGALDVIGGGLAGSTVLNRKRGNMLTGDFAPGARLTLHAKDLAIITDAAAKANLSLPLTEAVAGLVRTMIANGDGDLDHSALYKLAAESNGQQLPKA